MQSSILAAKFSGSSFCHDDPDLRKQEFDARIRILRQCGSKIILIIDDFWLPGRTLEQLKGEPSFADLENTNVHLIFTTRYQLNTRKDWHITALDENQLMAQIRKECDCDDDTLPDACLLPLVQAVDSNTLMAFLIAQTLKDGIITPEELLDILENGLQEGLELPQICDDRTLEVGTLFDHMYRLYDICNLDGETRQVLALTLLTDPEGLDMNIFMKCLCTDQQERFKNLYATSWVSRQNRKVSVRPVVRMICRGRLTPEPDSLRPFLERMRARWDEPRTTDPQRCQIRRYFDAASDWFGNDPQMGTWYNEIINSTEGG